MENNEALGNKLINLSLLAFDAEQKHKTLTKNLPKVLFESSNILMINTLRTIEAILGNSLSPEAKLLIGSTLQECAFVGLCIFDTRIQFARQLLDTEMQNINLFDIEKNKTRNTTAEEIVEIVIDAMEKGKKVDPIENTPPYVIKALTILTTKVFLGFHDAKITDGLTEKENEFLFSSLNYVIANSYFCGVVYIYLSTKPNNNSLQSFVKRTMKIK